LTCFGPLTQSIPDAALLLDALAGNRSGDRHRPPSGPDSFAAATQTPPPRLRIGLSFATPFGVPGRVDAEIGAAIERTAAQLGELGHSVEFADPSYGLVGLGMLPRGMNGVHRWLSEHDVEKSALEPRTRVHARLGKALGGAPLRLARAAEPKFAARIGRIFTSCDVLLTPTTAKPAPKVGALAGRGYWPTSTAASAACPFAWAWNVVGWPALSVPAGFTSAGLPIGAQLLGRENDERTLLALGAELERAGGEGWRERRPAP
jgi:amidase